MIQSISPYALLCACKPKPAPSIVTAYDLYSQAQCSAASSVPQEPPPVIRADTSGDTGTPKLPFSVPVQRTHYIAGIQSRHNAAIRRTPLQTHPLT